VGFPSPQEPLLLSVVVPAYNERPTIVEQLRRVAQTPFEKEIVIVDDGSNDGTREYLAAVATGEERIVDADGRGVSVKVILQVRNLGKGAAPRVRRGGG
jgi:glycosyltransferase involved in cell wall biosynthesis